MRSAGFCDVRTVQSRAVEEVVHGVRFQSVILRGFKLEAEDAGEDYGQVAVYRGTIPGKPKSFTLDLHNVFPSGQATRICRNTADILSTDRYASHFRVSEPIEHLGRFGAAAADATGAGEAAPLSTGSCC
jgi:hypothetical protein